MNTDQTDPVESMSSQQPEASDMPQLSGDPSTFAPKLKEGYANINIANVGEFYSSGKTLTDYLKDKIVSELPDKDLYVFVEEREEVRIPDYIQNPRPIRTFVVQHSTDNITKTFCFDVAACLV